MSSDANKRSRQRRRIDTDGDPEFQVAPMVDVLLVLMLFFMAITSTEVLKKEKNLHLPEAEHAKPDDAKHKNKNQVIINVAWNAQKLPVFTIDGVVYPGTDAIQDYLAGKAHQIPPPTVLIRADQSVEYSSISDIMTACASAGIGTVSFAALLNPGHTPAAQAQ